MPSRGAFASDVGTITVASPPRRTDQASGVVRVAAMTCVSFIPSASSPSVTAWQISGAQFASASAASESRRSMRFAWSTTAWLRTVATVASALGTRSPLSRIGSSFTRLGEHAATAAIASTSVGRIWNLLGKAKAEVDSMGRAAVGAGNGPRAVPVASVRASTRRPGTPGLPTTRSGYARCTS